jgi:hypothetical protein
MNMLPGDNTTGGTCIVDDVRRASNGNERTILRLASLPVLHDSARRRRSGRREAIFFMFYGVNWFEGDEGRDLF